MYLFTYILIYLLTCLLAYLVVNTLVFYANNLACKLIAWLRN